MRHPVSKLIALLAALLLGASAAYCADPAPAATQPASQDASTRLLPGSRILKTFDFEEQQLGNFDTVPMFWAKVAGRGFPLYTGGHFDTAFSRSATHSFKLELDGGSVAYQYPAGLLKLSPNADYFVIAFVKTSKLRYAKAMLSAWYADDQNQPVPNTLLNSERYAAPNGETDDWHILHLYLPANPAGRSLVLQLGLLQPQQLSNTNLGKFQLYEQDIKGAAWFDDITVFQLPRVTLSTNVPADIFSPGDPLDFNLSVSDLGRDHLTGKLTVSNAIGQAVQTQTWTLHPSPDAAWTGKFTLPPTLPAGFYTATLDVSDPRSLVTRRRLNFLLVDAGPVTAPAAEFGLDASDWPIEAWSDLPAILAQSRAGMIKLPAWRSEMTEDALLRTDPPFEQLVSRLSRMDIHVIASLPALPQVMMQKFDLKGDSLLGLLDIDPTLWRPYISFVTARSANKVSTWSVGQPADQFFVPNTRYPLLYGKLRTELSTLLDSPHMMIRWNALYDFDPTTYPGATLELMLPTVIPPAQIPTYISNFTQNGSEVVAHIQPLDDTKYTRLDRLSDFSQRLILTKASTAKALLVDLPVSRQTTLGNEHTEPSELLLVYRTLAQSLGGAKGGHELNLYPGIKAELFAKDGGGVLALWNSYAGAPQIALDLPLGEHPVELDILGHTTLLPVRDGMAHLTVGPVPILLTNIEPQRVDLRASFALGVATLPAGTGVVQTTIKLTNTYSDPLTGKLKLQAPPGWSFDPNVIQVNLGAGAALDAPITVRYPYGEPAGVKTIRARLVADSLAGPPIDLDSQVTLTSDIVDMQCLVQSTRDGQLDLQQIVTNISPSTINAQAYAMVPGSARQTRFLLNLQPGQTLIKRFTFPTPKDKGLATFGLRQTDGAILLTKTVDLE